MKQAYDVIEIILIEDDPNDAELTLRALKKSGVSNKVQHLKDGEEAMKYLFPEDITQHNYKKKVTPQSKLILLDLKLPKIDGFQILRRLKADDKMKTIPVVVLTSSQEEKDIVESYRLGVNSYISKPIDFDKFSAVIADIGAYWLLLNKAPNTL